MDSFISLLLRFKKRTGHSGACRPSQCSGRLRQEDRKFKLYDLPNLAWVIYQDPKKKKAENVAQYEVPSFSLK